MGTDARYGNLSDVDMSLFQNTFGRAPTKEESDLLNAQWHTYGVQSHTGKVGAHHYTSQNEVINTYANILNQAANQAKQYAGAVGVSITDEQASDIAKRSVNIPQIAGLTLKTAQNDVVTGMSDLMLANINRIGIEAQRNPTVTDQQMFKLGKG